jgi:hypothetical protein
MVEILLHVVAQVLGAEFSYAASRSKMNFHAGRIREGSAIYRPRPRKR